MATFANQYFTDPELARNLGFTGWSRPDTPADGEYWGEDDEGIDGGGPYNETGEVDATTGEDTIDLEQMLIGLFKEADADGSGSLDYDEFYQLMMTADIGLSKADIQLMISEADEDESGHIEYAEFVPLAVDVVQTMRLKHRAAEVKMREEISHERSRQAFSLFMSERHRPIRVHSSPTLLVERAGALPPRLDSSTTSHGPAGPADE